MSGRGGSGGKPPGGVIKKVAPPTIPDHHQHHHDNNTTQTKAPDTPTNTNNNNNTYRHSGSSFHSSSTTSSSSGVFSDQRASFSCSEDAVSTHSSNPPPSPCSPSSGTSSLDSAGGGSSNRGVRLVQPPPPASPSNYTTQGGQFTFPVPPPPHAGGPQFAHLLCKAPPLPHSPHHQGAPPHHSPDDQGIDVQSPVRSGSPSSGSGSSSTGSTASTNCCRNSTTSLDSGRASTTANHHHHSHHHQHHQHRLSGQSYDSGGSLRHSYHSSSSSIGSIDSPHLNVNDLLTNGVRDSEVLRAWLTELHLEEHSDKFVSSGYDLPTISRMTPEDLNAIGVTKPAHRKKLKAEITRLAIADGLPDYIPVTLDEWLSLLRLSEYSTPLQRQGYTSPHQMIQVMWEDLEEMGITRLGHQKKVMLAIKRMKDIRGGKKFSSSTPLPAGPPQEIVAIPRDTGAPLEPMGHPMGDLRTFSTGSRDSGYGRQQQQHNSLPVSFNPNGGQFSPNVYHRNMQHPLQHQQQQQQHASPLHHRQHGNVVNCSNNLISNNSNNHINNNNNVNVNSTSGSNNSQHPSVQYRPDIVTVHVHPQVRRNKDGVFEEPIYSTFHPETNRFSQYNNQQQQFVQHHQTSSNQFSSLPPRPNLPPLNGSSYHHPPRSLDDGDITPTNEVSGYEGGGGTLPRHKTANAKFRPVAKVTAKTRVDVHHEMSHNDTSITNNKPHNHLINNTTTNSITTTTTTTAAASSESNKHNGTNNKQLSNATKMENIYNLIHAHSTNNTPQGTPKKLPPPPPRRSNSISEASKLESLSNSSNKTSLPVTSSSPSTTTGCINASVASRGDGQYGYLRRSLNYGYMGVKNNLQPDIAPDLPPPPPAPHDVGNHQHIHHHHSHRRPQQQLLTEEDASVQQQQTYASQQQQQQQQKTTYAPATTATQQQQQQQSYVTPPTPDEFPPPPTSAESGAEPATGDRPRRNDSIVSDCSHKSTSSTDSSDSLPFANDNAGTIKQRCPPHLQPLASPHQSPAALRRPAGPPIRGHCSPRGPPAHASDDGNTDVLSDIGNMLANLTDELDAMLEQEMTS